MSYLPFPSEVGEREPDLTPRQRQVFEVLVGLHSRSAAAVGSETLASLGRIPWSPASIRAILAELEGLGLLEKPHTSAGRVPSPAGYRFYVRHLVKPIAPGAATIADLDHALRRSVRDVEDLVGAASHLLSEFSRQLGLAVAPELGSGILQGLELLPIEGARVLLVLTLHRGLVRTLGFELESTLDRSELAEVAAAFRERLIGLPMERVRERMASDPDLVRHGAARLVARALLSRWQSLPGAGVFTTGTAHIVNQPEFASHDELAALLRLVESGSGIEGVLMDGVTGRAAVRVGVNDSEGLSRCSLVSYRLPGSQRGAVGVLGPMRMDYGHVLGLVDAVGQRLAELLS